MNYLDLILFADSHLGYDYPLRPRIHIRRRGEDFFRNFDTVLNYAIRHRSHLVVHGGDLFYRSKVADAIIDRVYQSLSVCASSDIPVYIVPGNHERSSLPPSLFINHKNIHIFNQPKTYYRRLSTIKLALSGFPFVREHIREQFPTLLKRSGYGNSEADIQLLCLHQTIEGAKVGPVNFTFKYGNDIIPRIILPTDATAILSGHIHRRQILAHPLSPNTAYLPIIYPGSIERTSFAEKDEDKGFYHLIFTNDKNTGWYLKRYRFIPLPTRPMVKINIDMERSLQQIEKELIEVVRRIDHNSHIKLNLIYRPNNKKSNSLKMSRLRTLLPSTITVQIRPDLKKRKPA